MKYYTITVNGIAYEVSVEESNGSMVQATAPSSAPTPAPVVQKVVAPAPVVSTPVPTPTPTPVAPQPVASGVQGKLKVESPMPGKIISIKASVGQTVKRGDVILILEAMKMENEIVAPEAGTVASIDVTAGQMVESSVLLATLN